MKTTLFSAAMTLFYLSATTANAEPLPLAAFARQPQTSSAMISPDGRYIVTVSSINGQRGALTMDLQNPGKLTPVLSVKSEDNIDISWCRFANNTRVVCGLKSNVKTQRYTYATSKLAAVDVDGKNLKELMQNQRIDTTMFRDQVLDWTPEDPKTILVQARESANRTGTLLAVTEELPTVFKLDIYTGALTKLMSAHPTIRNYRTDSNGHVRLGIGLVGTKRVFFGRLLGDDSWRVLAKVEVFSEDNELIPLHVLPDTNKAYATSYHNGHRALWEIDLTDKDPPKMLFEHPQVDLAGFRFEEGTGKLLGYMYETDRPFVQYEDDRLGAPMSSVNKSLPSSFNVPTSHSNDFTKILIESTSDVDGGTYYVYDSATHKITAIGKANPGLKPQLLARMRSIQYPARDGTLIPGYITTPLDVRAENLPLIVMPHGGPIARDSWRYDFLRAFLASRGYAVLQMNFRGSDGYGNEWFGAANQDWGGLTYDDITDGTRWAIAKGIADPKRTCIVGWSFGGYAALLGATRNSDLYKCSVSIAGLSDLGELVQFLRNFEDRRIAEKQIGYDTDKLKNDSPVRHAKDVQMPVLLFHGTRDTQSPFEQSVDMEKALRSADKKVEFVKLENGEHALWRESERTTLLTKIEEFLEANIGPGTFPQAP